MKDKEKKKEVGVEVEVIKKNKAKEALEINNILVLINIEKTAEAKKDLISIEDDQICYELNLIYFFYFY